MKREANSISIERLKQENCLLKASIKKQKIELEKFKRKSCVSPNEIQRIENEFEAAKIELEQYKSHLEDVIKERTVELKNSEMRFLTLSDSLTGGAIFEVTLSREDIPWIGYMSKTVKSLLEFDVNAIQDNFIELYNRIHPDDLQRFISAFWISKQTKCEFNVEIRYVVDGKKQKWLHFRANAVEQTELYTVWVGIIIETTDKNLYQQEIQEREAILQAVIENIPFDFWARDSSLRCFLQNSASKKLWGDMIGKFPEEIPVEDDEKKILSNQIQRVIQGGIISEELLLADINGAIYNFQTLVAPILLQNKIKGVLGLNIDITDRKKVEQAVIQNEKKFRTIFDSSTDAVLIHSISGEFIEMNIEFKKILQNCQFQNAHNFYQILPEKDKITFKALINKDYKKQNIVFETEIETKVGDKIPIEIKSKEIEYLDGKAFLTLIQDITYRKKFERQLVTTIVETEEKERARFASDLHDDIGPILSSMKMLTGLLVDTKDFTKIKKISQQILDLVTESIRSVRETSNSISPHILKNYGIIAATKNIIQSFQHLIEINIHSNCENKRFESTTEIIYYRVMRELLNNTLKHANATKISISLNYKDSNLILEYIDNGEGFNVEEKLNHTSEGMGLYNILSRIKSLDANYSLTSETKNGTHFILETKIPN